MMRRLPTIWLLASALALSGCLDSDSHEWFKRIPPDDGPAPAKCALFSVEHEITDRFGQPVDTFSQFEPIRFESRVTNDSDAPQTLMVASGCPQIHFVVTDVDDNILWTSGDGFACTAAVREVTYQPGETEVFSAEWDQVMRNGKFAPTGDYTAFADDSSECRPAFSSSAELFIR